MTMQSNLLDVIAAAGDRIVMDDGRRVQLSGKQLAVAVQELADKLKRYNGGCVALRADNGINWIVADLAAQLCGCTLVPIPLFFSRRQAAHVLQSSGCDTLLSDDPDFVGSLAKEVVPYRITTGIIVRLIGSLCLHPILREAVAQIPEGTEKITFTSGSTGTPKGVCLSSAHQLQVAKSLANAININGPRHLCVLPLSTLLENIAGVYAPLLAGGRVIAPALEELGLQGSSGLDPQCLLQKISEIKPDTIILVPELLDVLVRGMAHGWKPPASLQFVAVGGGKVSTTSISEARELGLPVYEGYGLSECGSVVSLNVPGNDHPGSAGQPLPHVDVSIQNEEIMVSGAAFLGYLNEPQSWTNESIATGDLGQIDSKGFLHILGRIKNQLISSFGRNISPEWIEAELIAGPILQQAVVVGDARPYCAALVSTGNDDLPDTAIADWISTVNATLPDYARIGTWQRLSTPMTVANQQLTDNGRLRRAQIHSDYADTISELYEQPLEVAHS